MPRPALVPADSDYSVDKAVSLCVTISDTLIRFGYFSRF